MKRIDIETYRVFKWIICIFLLLTSLSLWGQNFPEGEFLSLDPEAVTGESFGFVTAIAKSPSDGSLWIGTEDEGILRIGRKGNRIHYSTDG